MAKKQPPTYRMREYGDPSRNEPLIAIEMMALPPAVAEAVIVALRVAAPDAYTTRIYYDPQNPVDVITEQTEKTATLRAQRILTKRGRAAHKATQKLETENG